MNREATLIFGVLSCVASLALSAVADAAQVKGIVDPPRAAASRGRLLGYTSTRVASPAVATATKRVDTALLLAAKAGQGLPIEVKPDPFKVSIVGLRFTPSTAACVVDQKVAFTNDDRSPMTLLVDQKPFATIAPGESKTYDCTTPGIRKLRVKEWPHMRASVYVGEIGVVSQAGANGAFAIAAPQGKYELLVLGEDGPIAKRDVELVKADVDVGHIGAEADVAENDGKGAEPGAKPGEANPKPVEAPKPAKVVPKPVPKPKPAPVEAAPAGDETGTE